MQSLAIFISRILFSVLFIWSGLYHLYNWGGPLTYWIVEPSQLNYWGLSGIVIVQLVSGFCLMIGFCTRFFSLVLMGFVIYASIHFHTFSAIDKQTLDTILNTVLKNGAIVSGLLLLLVFGAGRISVDYRKKQVVQKSKAVSIVEE